MKKNILKERNERIKKLMREKDMDAVVALSLENVFYTTGAYIMTQRAIRDRLEIAVLPKKGEAVFIACKIEEKLAKEETWIEDMRTYIEFKESPIQFLVSVLKEMGLEKGRIGIEQHYLTAYYHAELTNAMPDAEFIECQDVFDEIQMIKEPGEIEILAKAAKGTRKAADAAFLSAKVGDTEKELANQMIINLLNQGVDELSFMVLGTGKRSIYTHPTPGDTPLCSGDILRVDFGGLFSGYFSDLARTAVVGNPSPLQADVYKKLATIQKEVIYSLQVGVRFCDVYNKCKELYKEKDLPFNMPHIGHGLGVGLHEHPIINPLNEKKVQENMVINVEPLVVYGDGAYHIEDLILTTKNGPKILTESSMSDEIPIIN
ncbi:MAG: Xaa-Pro peptidase family protein [Atribacterota bacterium]|nr:Xaa-Pro peptidase family protein [Atribacterota bacterium]